MQIVSIINYKGGVGKTTLTANLAAELAWRGHSVLMVDLDAQASLTFSFISPDDWQNNFANSKTIKKWFDSFECGHPLPLSEIIFTPPRVATALRTRSGSLDMIASHLGLISACQKIDIYLNPKNKWRFKIAKNFHVR